MSKGSTSTALSEEQFAEIEAAVMESERGRTFLREFLARNRHADTKMLLEAISRLESALCLKTIEHEQQVEFTPTLADIASVVTATRTEIAAIRNDLITGGGAIPEGEEPFSAAAEEAGKLSTDLLTQVETLENLAWRLREDGADKAVCDQLDTCIDELMALCWKQDVSGQRSAKAMSVLSFVSERTGGNLLGAMDLPGEVGASSDLKALPSAEMESKAAAFFEADADLFSDEAFAPLPVETRPALMPVEDEPEIGADEPEEKTAAEAEVSIEAEAESSESAAAEGDDDGGNGHIVIIRTPSEPAAQTIPEPAEKKDSVAASGEVPLVSIPAQRPA